MGVETAWAAGLFEGEGYVGIKQSNKPNHNPQVSLVLGMTDEDVVSRFARWASCGSLRWDERGPDRKPLLFWRATGIAAVRVLGRLWPHMGLRRWEAMAEGLVALADARHGAPNVQARIEAKRAMALSIMDGSFYG